MADGVSTSANYVGYFDKYQRSCIVYEGGAIYFNAAISRKQNYSANVPTYPTEKGFEISDAVVKHPLSLNVEAMFSDMSLSTYDTQNIGNANMLTVTYDSTSHFGTSVSRAEMLKDAFYRANPVKLITPTWYYENMVIESITIPEEQSMRRAFTVSIVLKQVNIVSNTVSTISVYNGGTGESSTINNRYITNSNTSEFGGMSYWLSTLPKINGH